MAYGDLIADPVAWASALSEYRSAEEAFTDLSKPGAQEVIDALESALHPSAPKLSIAHGH